MQYTKSVPNPAKRKQLFGVSKFLLNWLWRHAICYLSLLRVKTSVRSYWIPKINALDLLFKSTFLIFSTETFSRRLLLQMARMEMDWNL